MPSLNIRNFPPDLLKALKVEAARRVVTLRVLVLEDLKAAIRFDDSGFPIFDKPKEGK